MSVSFYSLNQLRLAFNLYTCIVESNTRKNIHARVCTCKDGEDMNNCSWPFVSNLIQSTKNENQQSTIMRISNNYSRLSMDNKEERKQVKMRKFFRNATCKIHYKNYMIKREALECCHISVFQTWVLLHSSYIPTLWNLIMGLVIKPLKGVNEKGQAQAEFDLFLKF